VAQLVRELELEERAGQLSVEEVDVLRRPAGGSPTKAPDEPSPQTPPTRPPLTDRAADSEPSGAESAEEQEELLSPMLSPYSFLGGCARLTGGETPTAAGVDSQYSDTYDVPLSPSRESETYDVPANTLGRRRPVRRGSRDQLRDGRPAGAAS